MRWMGRGGGGAAGEVAFALSVATALGPKTGLLEASDSGRIVGKPETIRKRGSRKSDRDQPTASPRFPEPDFWTTSRDSICPICTSTRARNVGKSVLRTIRPL